MARFWACVAGAGFFLAFLVLHSRFCGFRLPPHLHFAFKISWRAEEILYRLDVDWPMYSEYFTGATFCVAVDSLNGLVYVAQFDNPAELYVEDTGDIYIVDGDGGLNNRLIKLSQDYMILWLHGENGTGPAKFNIPHSVTVDSAGRVWVADRGNKRLQVFDKDSGEWLGAWNNCFTEEGPSSVRFTPDGKYLIAAQLRLSRLLVAAAPPVGSIGRCSVISTIQLADQVSPHLLDVSAKTGAIYVAEIGAKQVQKFVPMKSSFSSFGSYVSLPEDVSRGSWDSQNRG
uniref:NHL repeat-containing protein 3 isoform X4 n=1 Tax=Camelus bactrianus TaxID=9837 RepID=A0A9W3G0H9_CAMBA|nr:NHL repeat-containing protein 3 isoform X4 [Camelus bactrianus]